MKASDLNQNKNFRAIYSLDIQENKMLSTQDLIDVITRSSLEDSVALCNSTKHYKEICDNNQTIKFLLNEKQEAIDEKIKLIEAHRDNPKDIAQQITWAAKDDLNLAIRDFTPIKNLKLTDHVMIVFQFRKTGTPYEVYLTETYPQFNVYYSNSIDRMRLGLDKNDKYNTKTTQDQIMKVINKYKLETEDDIWYALRCDKLPIVFMELMKLRNTACCANKRHESKT